MTAGTKDFAANADFPLLTQHLGLLGDDRSLALAYSASFWRQLLTADLPGGLRTGAVLAALALRLVQEQRKLA